MSVCMQQMLQSARHSITPSIKHKEVSKMGIKQNVFSSYLAAWKPKLSCWSTCWMGVVKLAISLKLHVARTLVVIAYFCVAHCAYSQPCNNWNVWNVILPCVVKGVHLLHLHCAGFHVVFGTLACKSWHIYSFELICIGDPTVLSYLNYLGFNHVLISGRVLMTSSKSHGWLHYVTLHHIKPA